MSKHRRGSDDDASFAIPPAEVSYWSSETGFDWPETGLRKFNLGTIPASVTPPRTWRRAAWFAVFTAAFVACGMGFVSFALIGHPKPGTTIDALPGQPSQRLTIIDLPSGQSGGDSTPPSSPPAASPAPHGTATPQTAPPTPPAATGNTGTTETGGSSGTAPATTTQRPLGHAPRPSTLAAAGAPSPPAAPSSTHPSATRNTLAAAPLSVTNTSVLRDRTEQYYRLVSENPKAACELTSGRLHMEGPEGIRSRYAGVVRVQLKSITVDPAWSATRSRLVLVYGNGATRTVDRALTFTAGPDPRIISDSRVG